MLLFLFSCSENAQEVKPQPKKNDDWKINWGPPTPIDTVDYTHDIIDTLLDENQQPSLLLKFKDGLLYLLIKKENKWIQRETKCGVGAPVSNFLGGSFDQMQLNNRGLKEVIVTFHFEYAHRGADSIDWSISYQTNDVYDLDADSVIFSIYDYYYEMGENDNLNDACQFHFETNQLVIDSVSKGNSDKRLKPGVYGFSKENKLIRIKKNK